MKNKDEIIKRIRVLYPDCHEALYLQLVELIDKWKSVEFMPDAPLTCADVMLVTYGDSIKSAGEKPLKTLYKFVSKYVKGIFSALHILPIYPFTSDDGFSVVDYRQVDESLGEWTDIEIFKNGFDLMLDAVINHVSRSSEYFKEYLSGNEEYKNYFIECDPKIDYSMVIRPRALPLLTPVNTKNGLKHVWTTFSDDQIDFNYREPKVLIEILDILFMYISHGSRFLRFDAIGIVWKQMGTKCMHLPETHMLIQLMRYVLEEISSPIIITETNVPHADNISYFGNGSNEAALVYQFPLPPLTLFSFVSEDTSYLTSWAKSYGLPSDRSTFLNFLSSHDGIGVRPIEAILSESEKVLLIDRIKDNGGRINYRNMPDGSVAPYELNITYMDAITKKDDSQAVKAQKMLAAHSILLSLLGMPAIYIHSLLGSRNYIKGVEESGINRRINREKLSYNQVEKDLSDCDNRRHKVFYPLLDLISIRKNEDAFSPFEPQKVLDLGNQVFAIIRGDKENQVFCCVNVTGKIANVQAPFCGYDLISKTKTENNVVLNPYQFVWIKK